MPAPFQAVIALQARAGMCFGSVQRIRADTVTFEVESDVQEGERLAWRMELTGRRETVMGELRVLRVRPPEGRGPLQVTARLLDMPARDRMRLSEWVQEQEEGGTTRRFDADASSGTTTWSYGRAVGGATQRETEMALKRMDERRAGSSVSSAVSAAKPDVLGLSSEVSSVGAAGGRAALRDALRAGLERRKTREPTPAVPEWAARKPAEAPASAPAAPAPRSSAAAAARPDPEIEVIPHTHPARVRITYRSPDVYKRDHQQHIRCAALFLPLPDIGKEGTPLALSITPPAQPAVSCQAEVKVQMPTGVGLLLVLDAGLKDALKPK